ncbi:hypothetical protein ACC710_37680, partial [Rhizobium ruizarguesonis]
FTGAYAINPANGARLPVWVADYVLAVYGTGALIAVPAHDARDYAFAHSHERPIIRVIDSEDDIENAAAAAGIPQAAASP